MKVLTESRDSSDYIGNHQYLLSEGSIATLLIFVCVSYDSFTLVDITCIRMGRGRIHKALVPGGYVGR